METRYVVLHNKANGQWELQGSMKHDEFWDTKHLVPMKKEAY